MNLSAQIPLFSGVSFLEKLLFTKHLSIMIKSGLVISESIHTLIEQTKSITFKNVLTSIVTDIENGRPLASALSKHPRVFDQFYISLIEVGEESGTLEDNLEFLAKQLAKDYSMRKKVKGAMLYPGLIFFTVTIMGGFISLFILPQLVDFFESFDIELPLPTKILLYIANLMKTRGIIIITSFIVAFVSFTLLIKTKFIKPLWHRLLLKLPIIGVFLVSVNIARLTRNLGTMLRSGVTVIRSLEVTANTLDNLTFQQALFFAQDEVRKGKQLAKGMEKFSFIPPLVTKMIAIGEKTGKLEEVLLYLGDFYEEEIDEFSKNLSTILEPILLISIGLVVGFVAIAIISPIYQLTGSFR